jgi:lysozyme
MVTSLVEQIVRDEGCSLKPYRDSVGKLTIGVGRNLDDVGIRQDEAMILLQNDLMRATQDVLRALPWAANLDLIRRAALTNMAFNMGIGKLLGFVHMLENLKCGKYQEAAESALNSHWAQQVGARATRLAEQIKTGTWQ